MMASLKLAVLIAVGPLDRYGYQYNHIPILTNLSSFATRIYICSSTRNRNGVDNILSRFPNLVYISDTTSWLPMNERGEEIFQLSQLVVNINRILAMARADGMDCATNFAINQYLPEENQQNFLAECKAMLVNGNPFCWMYKRIQLANQLFETDRRVPYNLNLHYSEPMMYDVDALHFIDTGAYYRSTLGNYRDKKKIATVDVSREMTIKDLEEMRCFIRNYDEINPGVDPVFIWERDKQREISKYSAKTFSLDRLSPTGQIIAGNSRPDFVSHYLLRVHPANVPGYMRVQQRMMSKIKNLPGLNWLARKVKKESK